MMSDGTIDVYYSPFDAIKPRAKICIVGISPGKTQAENANLCASELINNGETSSIILEKVKDTASFSGALRSNLINLLDYLGLNTHWGLESASQLFSTDQHLLHSTSVFRYPVLVNGEPISSAKQGLTNPILKQMVDTYLASECQRLPDDVLFIPLGKGTSDILAYLAQQGFIKSEQILKGLPHPSGANAERLAYFMENKSKESLSSKTNSKILNEMKSELFQQLTDLGVKLPRGDRPIHPMVDPSQHSSSKRISSVASGSKKSMRTLSKDVQASDLRSPIDKFIRDDVEQQLRALLAEMGLDTNPNKSRTSKELAVSSDGAILAYISRKTGLKDARLTVCVHPKHKKEMDHRVQQIDNVSIKTGRNSRYISSSNYSGFNSKGYCADIDTNEHIAIAYIIEVSGGYQPIISFFNQYLEVK
ncbi:hypothetical protein [Vibrio sp. PID23_8]|uniref:hypothetical protein n=2 Tax=Vibrionaceae TaxID=641 RepID=UPI001C71B81E|nr:hypothetical protein [Vibrio sp. PID23_8]